MKNFDFRNLKIKNMKIIVITVPIIVMVAVIIISLSLMHRYKNRESSIFSIKEIILYSNANVINNSDNQSLTNLSICQYSDLSIYIDNSIVDSQLTDENTIKELYIDDISITSKNDTSTQTLNYKNPLTFGKSSDIQQPTDNKIDFKIINTNEQNNMINYNYPTFYTDCSNPITLGYLNKNIVQNYSISDTTNKVSYNAKILKEANVTLDDINHTLNFTVHIVNNSNRKFYCNMSINLALDEDFLNNGYSYIRLPASDGEYKFFRE